MKITELLCEWYAISQGADIGFYKTIFLNDEATLRLNGTANRHNCVCWDSTNLIVVMASPISRYHTHGFLFLGFTKKEDERREEAGQLAGMSVDIELEVQSVLSAGGPVMISWLPNDWPLNTLGADKTRPAPFMLSPKSPVNEANV
ncbi:hypothetical protein J6590_059809 [Homalodisca vitripennis]|nr:hypothetical protein J6590_059809 [Homalodisca vitripennis]